MKDNQVIEDIKNQRTILHRINTHLYHINRIIDGQGRSKIIFEFDVTYKLYAQNDGVVGYYTLLGEFNNRGQLYRALKAMANILRTVNGERI